MSSKDAMDDMRDPDVASAMRAEEAAEAKAGNRQCTCHPDDRPEPCARRFATNHCWRSAVYDETKVAIVNLKNMDRSPAEQNLLDHLMRVERALDGSF